jgi:pyruvate formate lyase activating enzyme
MLRENRCIRCGLCLPACPEHAIQRTAQDYFTDLALCNQCGECVPVCPAEAREIVGQPVSVEHLMEEIKRDIPFFDESGGGVTFSGGEPLMQPRFLLQMLQACQGIELHTALDTSGYADWSILDPISEFTDLFLYDLKLVDPQAHQKYCGVSNELILSNLRKLSQKGSAIYLRVPVIPGITDTRQNLDQIAGLARSLPGIKRVDILPYHQAALGKYSRLNLSYRLDEIIPPSQERMIEIQDQLQQVGLQVKIGG